MPDDFREKYKMPPKGDVPNNLKYTVESFLGKAEFEFDTKETSRTLYFKGKAKDMDVITKILQDYSNKQVNKASKERPSVLEKLKKFKEIVAAIPKKVAEKKKEKVR